MKILTKQPHRDFVILNFTDPQLSDEEWNEDRFEGRLLTETVTRLVETVRPDLITVSGDLAWSNQYVSYRRFADLMESFGIPWAPVFGNHDQEHGPEGMKKAAEILLDRPHCLFSLGDPALGFGNYTIGIEENGRLIHEILMMDSHNVLPRLNDKGEEYLAWAELIPEQFAWYREAVAEAARRGARETSIILHIPLYAYRDAARAALKPEIDPASVPCGDGEQVGCWNEGYEDSFGVLYEGICSHPEDNGFFEEIVKAGSTKTVLCGHDHVNSLSVRYRGVLLLFGLKTGAGCYWNEKLNGGTVLTVDSDGHMTARHCFAGGKIP